MLAFIAPSRRLQGWGSLPTTLGICPWIRRFGKSLAEGVADTSVVLRPTGSTLLFRRDTAMSGMGS